jgi:hypothetical protein
LASGSNHLADDAVFRLTASLLRAESVGVGVGIGIEKSIVVDELDPDPDEMAACSVSG